MKWYIMIYWWCGVVALVDRDKYNALISLTHELALDYYQCEDMYSYGSEVYSDFKDFWNPRRLLFRPQTGCLLLCIGVQRSLLDDEGNLSEDSLLDAIKFVDEPALDDEALQIMKSLGHQCHREVTLKADTNDACLAAIRRVQCIRVGFVKLKWAPGPGEDYRRQLGLPSKVIYFADEAEDADFEDFDETSNMNETRSIRNNTKGCT